MQRGLKKKKGDSIILKFYSLNFFFQIGSFFSEDHRASYLRGRKILQYYYMLPNMYLPNNLFHINSFYVVPEA